MHAILDDKSGGGSAELTRVQVAHHRGNVDGLVHVCIVKDDQWALATELESDTLQVVRSALHDVLAALARAGEGNLADVGVVDQGLASDVADTGEAVEDAWDDAWRLVPQVDELEGGERGELGWL